MGRRTFFFLPQVNINPAAFNSRTNQFITGHGPFVTYLHRFGLCSHDRCVCCAKGDPNHYATVCLVTKPFRSTKPSAENLSTWCENIVQDRRCMVSSWIKKDFSRFHQQLRLSLQTVSVYSLFLLLLLYKFFPLFFCISSLR
ncbi:hypothetical protein AVEN_236372-1 [Araneus ventricosus]|uniref:Uncharacterized protein n=1 Tax=Araneus ventricosus TaxID=182803 RepID=A0A4Y2VW06_ARAVE|nr:hypothetical protein AVEN_236372-1 [Araneus ventricosus]